ncbi:MAG: ABC transporter ATP-binding protein [Planctomycetota bacterium]|nr:ABC transporter ATP-binding protein [Planctomycetota bacterium]
MALISAENLRKTYRLGKVDVPVLRGVTMRADEGELVAILGASGSGKSTLLHLLGGLDRPDKAKQGEKPAKIVFAGRDLAQFSSGELDSYRTREVGMVFQFYHLLPELSVVENVWLPAMIRLSSRQLPLARVPSDVRDRAEALLKRVGLGHRLGHRPVELSGGERQRVAIARALINDPVLLLADEPTGNLDRATGTTILDLLDELRREPVQPADGGQARRRTMVLVTHDSHTAARADRVLKLDDGVMVKA